MLCKDSKQHHVMFHELNSVSSLLCIAQNVRFEIPYKDLYFETPFLMIFKYYAWASYAHLRFDKFHHNKRIALQLQRCILGSCAYLCSFSWVPDPILSRRKSLLNTKLAFPGMRFHLKCTHESLRAAFRRQNVPQPGRGLVRIVHKQKATLRSSERSV